MRLNNSFVEIICIPQYQSRWQYGKRLCDDVSQSY